MAEPTESPDIRTAEARPLTGEAAHLRTLGAQQLEEARYQEARETLVRATELAPNHAHIRSLLGLSVAYVDRDFQRARELCESAAKQEFFNPELYLNLARVYLIFDRRSEAMRYLRRGQMIDPGNRAIQKDLASLGRRRIPVVPFLPRRHPINRALGEARSMIRSNVLGRANP